MLPRVHCVLALSVLFRVRFASMTHNSLRILGTVGEPNNQHAWEWRHQVGWFALARLLLAHLQGFCLHIWLADVHSPAATLCVLRASQCKAYPVGSSPGRTVV